jgi:hypothetical protein
MLKKISLVTVLLAAFLVLAVVSLIIAAMPVRAEDPPHPGGIEIHKPVSPQFSPTEIETVVDGQPLTAVIVTQCSLLVVVYFTTSDGRLLRFDKASGVPFDRLLSAASSAIRNERVEVSCNGEGAVGYERHDPT